ncbi:carboxypeptidase-like regulatory domain-containing protein [Eudoraea chungangensis]|uniref:carboxypeptidase-like regulatory domain-containing protein n=1 Tax=Eudoraea chungangensis TaxID=1481905 RepID=UPI0023EBB303|nr:carboxypeptidase-like regulatory domain-containing protein [Eudoraea chungangensis]
MKLNYFTLSLILILGFTSCSDSEDSTPDPVTSANIIGSVNLYDEGTSQIDNSGMTVKLEDTSFSATTDVQGDFTLTNVPFGTYTIIYEKAGFGTYKKFDLKHSNTSSSTIITETPSIGQMSSTEITNIAVTSNTSNIIISATTNPAGSNGNTRYVRYFLSENADVSNENYNFYSQGLISQINPYDINLSQDDLISAGFTTGQTIHIKVYGDSFWSNEYNNPNLQIKVFPNLNMTSTSSVSFVVP